MRHFIQHLQHKIVSIFNVNSLLQTAKRIVKKLIRYCFLLFLLITILISSQNQAKAVAGGVIFILTAVNQMLRENDEYAKHCNLDMGCLLKKVVGPAGPQEEADACFANMVTLGTTSFAIYFIAYEVTYNVCETMAKSTKGYTTFGEKLLCQAAASGSAMAYSMASALATIGIWYGVSAEAAKALKVCKDDEYHPLAYTNETIGDIIDSNSQDKIEKYYDKICIQDTRDDKRYWLKRNQCTVILGVTVCAHRPQGYDGILCVRTSSTMPCSHEINNGNMNVPTIQTSGDKILYDNDGNVKINGGDDNFMKHCRFVTQKNDLFTKESSGLYALVDEACRGNGSSKYGARFLDLTLVVECTIGTFRNMLEKSVSTFSTTIALSDEDAEFINKLQHDKAIISGLAGLVRPYAYKFTVEEVNQTLADPNFTYNSQVINNLRLGKVQNLITDASGVSQSLLVYDKYRDKLAEIPEFPFDGTTQQVTDLKQVETFSANILNALGIIESTDMDIANLIVKTSSGNVTALKDTLLGRLQGVVKATTIMCVVLYFAIIGLKLLLGDMELNQKELLTSFINIGVVVYFAIGDGWKDIGVNVIMRASAGVAEIVSDAIRVDLRDGCMSQTKTFIVKPSDVKEKADVDIDTTSAIRYIENATDIPSDLGAVNRDKIDKICTDTYSGSGRIMTVKYNIVVGEQITEVREYQCRRGEYVPKYNYKFPFMPVGMPSILQLKMRAFNYTGGYLPLRCTDVKGDLLYFKDSSKTSVSTNPTNYIYYAEPSTWGVNEYLTCKYKPADGMAYTAQGPHKDDLVLMGYTPIDVADNLNFTASLILPTAIYVVNSYGVLSFPPYLGGEKFNNLLTRYSTARVVDKNRKAINKDYKNYPIVKTDSGSIRDWGFLSIFDGLSCVIDKTVMANNEGFPQIITFMLQSLFSGLVGVMLFTTLAAFTVIVFVVCLKVTQNFIVGMVCLCFYIYLAPVVIPTMLFNSTKKIFESWKESLISYIIYPPSTFLVISVVIKVVNIVMYGTEGDYNQEKLFNADGSVSKNCVDGKPKDADTMSSIPYLCLIQYTADKFSWGPAFMITLILLPVTPWIGIAAGVLAAGASTGAEKELEVLLFKKSLYALIAVYLLAEISDKIMKILQEMFGGKDLSIKGGVGSISQAANPSTVAASGLKAASTTASIGRNVSSGSMYRMRAAKKNSESYD